jgi:hypothetical protein
MEKKKVIVFYVRRWGWTPERPVQPTNVFAWDWHWEAVREWEKTRKKDYYWDPVYKDSLAAAHLRTGYQRLGDYRVGTSYRRNPEHKPKERDENREVWRKSRKDWRHHHRGWRRRCDCSACCGWIVANRGADLSRMARKSWVTTKNIRGLQDHLDLYVAYWNEYQL